MIRPLATRYQAWFYDGRQAVRHAAEVELESAGLRITVNDEPFASWPYADLGFSADGSYGEPVRIERASGETLVIESPDFMEALRQHGIATGGLRFELRSWPAVVLGLIAVVAIAGAMYTWGVSFAADRLAGFLPRGIEDRVGRSVVSLLAPDPLRCGNAEARARLQPILDRLVRATGSSDHFELIYVNSSIVNAFAAPGGYIVVYRGLIEQSATPEEFAGVVAHEMQHVLLRHSARAIARQFSGRALLSLMAVDSSGTPAAIQAGAQLAGLRYQRSDEQAADLGAAELLDHAGLGREGLIVFFRRLQGLGDSTLQYLSSHPALSERIRALQGAGSAGKESAQPLMTPDEWYQAKQVCLDK
jgi:Zn-dependent protease with chaperone function